MTPKGLCIVTRCTSSEELIARLNPFCDESSIFVTTHRMWPLGIETRFAITLADKSVVLRGRCLVVGAWPDGANEFGRPGVRLGVVELDVKSQEVFAKMQAARMRSTRVPVPVIDAPTERSSPPSFLHNAAVIGRVAPARRDVIITARSTRDAVVMDRAVAVDTARSSSPPMPPRATTNAGARPPPPPRMRAPFGTPLHGSVPLGTPMPGRRMGRGTNSVIGLGPCPGATAIPIAVDDDESEPVTLVSKPPRPEDVYIPRPGESGRFATVEPAKPHPNVVVFTAGVSEREQEHRVAFVSLPPPPVAEAREPGKMTVLPANPLMGLSDDAIAGFIDCTLYEDFAELAIPDPVPVTLSLLNRVITDLAACPDDAEEVEPYEEAEVIVPLAPVNRAQLPTIDSFAARLPWRSIGTIATVAIVSLTSAFLVLFNTGQW